MYGQVNISGITDIWTHGKRFLWNFCSLAFQYFFNPITIFFALVTEEVIAMVQGDKFSFAILVHEPGNQTT